jgi:hypothetical protein
MHTRIDCDQDPAKGGAYLGRQSARRSHGREAFQHGRMDGTEREQARKVCLHHQFFQIKMVFFFFTVLNSIVCYLNGKIAFFFQVKIFFLAFSIQFNYFLLEWQKRFFLSQDFCCISIINTIICYLHGKFAFVFSR